MLREELHDKVRSTLMIDPRFLGRTLLKPSLTLFPLVCYFRHNNDTYPVVELI